MENKMERNLQCGYLCMYIGPMFSSKTMSIITEICRYYDLGCKCLIINHSIDERVTKGNTRNLSYHSGCNISLPEDIDVVSTNDLNSVNVQGYKCIGVDEAQFYSNVDVIKEWVDLHGCHVFVSGLDGSSERQAMGSILSLIPHCDDIQKLKAKCSVCMKYRNVFTDAIFTHCKVAKDSTIYVGGSDIYQPVCRTCYNKLK